MLNVKAYTCPTGHTLAGESYFKTFAGGAIFAWVLEALVDLDLIKRDTAVVPLAVVLDSYND